MIHLDANATSKLRPAAHEALLRHLAEDVRSASSIYSTGRAARTELSKARKEVLQFLFGESKRDAKLFFTSGGTESCNTLLHGFLSETSKAHVLTTAIEHAAILEPLAVLEKEGWSVTKVASKSDGRISVEEFVGACRSDTALVVVMAANNESGALQPVAEISRKLRASGYSGPIVSDITQALGKSELNLEELFRAGVSAAALSGHKLGALPGIGAVVLAGESFGLCFSFHPFLKGGAHEEGYRSGTENLPAIVTLAAVCRELGRSGREERQRVAALREQLWNRLASEAAPVMRLSFSNENALSNTLLLQIPECRGDDFVVALDLLGVAISRGSACNSGKQNVSHVVTAMGITGEPAKEVVRISLDWDATEKSVQTAAGLMIKAIRQMRGALAQAA